MLMKIRSGNKEVHNQPNKETFWSLLTRLNFFYNKHYNSIKITQLMKIDSTRHHFV